MKVVATLVCPVCHQPGRLLLFAPIRCPVVVHPGPIERDGRQRADEACILSGDEARGLLEEWGAASC